MFTPDFQITPALSKALMDIEASRQAVSSLPITVPVLTSLRESARLVSTHYSTQIEGNRLTQAQVEDVIHGGTFPNRERDEREVKNYYQALDFLDTLVKRKAPVIAEKDIQTLHGLVMNGKKKPTTYRDGQNVIKDSGNSAIVYMPPEAKDVPELMCELMAWINDEVNKGELPIPLIAGIAHYQFATVHPYYDGNGRTARLLTNLVLHKSGYGLKGIYSLEEYYARDLQAYYQALSIGESHNYYFGRAEANITAWVMYFCEGMADSFANVRLKATEASKGMKRDQSPLLRELDQRQKQVLSLFEKSKYITTREIADLLGVHTRTALNQCNKWCDEGFIIRHGAAPKSRKYELADKWLELVQ
ncbi:MAG: cell filamentation protein Fic [SAR86 cluster bacterium]|uniref:Cell filamentation protein Fic n=1 Tax=SAR86 cluster bacterium TaxID=2030880 RepID=A0A2A5CJG5_9GAMM|nr:MAG: cell filamentation protein Fic [SAR86 cluster bacterium]